MRPTPVAPDSERGVASPEAAALLFPGQGSQRVGMGKRLAAEHAAARDTFAEADDALGLALSRLCFDGPESELTLTEHCQPAILCASIALWRALGAESGLAPRWLAGHSLGEYTALVVAGAMTFPDAIRLVRLRGRLMQTAVPAGVGTMAAVIGLDDAAVAEICRAAANGEVVAPANLNGAGQVVIAGHRDAVARAVERARAAGGRTVALAVSAPFHCALMAPAAAELAAALAAVEILPLALPVVSNVDAELNHDPARVRELLTAQMTAPVRWAESMQRLSALGCARAIEVGPGQVLTKILQRMRLGIAGATLEEVGAPPAAAAGA